MKTDLPLPAHFRVEERPKIEKFIWEYSKKNPDGFTISINLEGDMLILRKVTSGKVAAYAETQKSFGIEGLRRCLINALQNSHFLGGWLEDGLYYFDCVKVFLTLEEAIAFGKEQSQISVFDIDENLFSRL